MRFRQTAKVMHMSSRAFGQLFFLAGILLLAVLLLILSRTSDGMGKGMRTQLRHCGVTGFLAKPFLPQVLVEKVRQALERQANSAEA